MATGSAPGFSTIHGALDYSLVAVTPTNAQVMASNVNYTVKFTNKNPILPNGIITI